MVEVQAHGFSFEKWVRDHFFGGYKGNYMQKWDVPSDHNTYDAVPSDLRNLNVSIKTAKFSSPIGLGDVLRQRQINEPFVMIVGFWKQVTATEKQIVDIGVVQFTPNAWLGLWGDLTLAELQQIDVVIKNQRLPYREARARAREWKLRASVSTSILVINPKIDSGTQRRIQCSLPYSTFWRFVGRNANSHDCPELWGHVFPNPIRSAARKFNH